MPIYEIIVLGFSLLSICFCIYEFVVKMDSNSYLQDPNKGGDKRMFMNEEARYIHALDEIDNCIRLCYCSRFSKLRGVDGVILVRPADIKNRLEDIVYNIVVLSENMNAIEGQIVFIEELVKDYIKFKNAQDATNITAAINVIYTQISNMKNVIGVNDSKVEAYISSRKFGTPNSDEIIRGSFGVYVKEDNVYCANFERVKQN